jgi:hypothetical protein
MTINKRNKISTGLKFNFPLEHRRNVGVSLQYESETKETSLIDEQVDNNASVLVFYNIDF